MLIFGIFYHFVRILFPTSKNLSVVLDGPLAVQSVEDLLVHVKIMNTGHESLNILNHPLSPLNDLSTDIFDIKGSDNLPLSFIGSQVTYRRRLGKDFTVLAPGESVTILNNLSQSYDFPATTFDSYRVRLKGTFYHVEDDGSVTDILANYGGPLLINVDSTMKSNISITDEQFDKCSAEQIKMLKEAMPVTKQIAEASIEYLKHNPLAEARRYLSWFGKPSESRCTKVVDIYERIVSLDSQSLNYHCEKGKGRWNDCKSHVDQFGVIHICPTFFRGKISAQAGRLLHEAIHYLMIHEDKAKRIVDHTSGRYGCLRLAYEYPDKAVHNAESYRCFALNLNVEPKNYECL